jgi:hypothetical protein
MSSAIPYSPNRPFVACYRVTFTFTFIINMRVNVFSQISELYSFFYFLVSSDTFTGFLDVRLREILEKQINLPK